MADIQEVAPAMRLHLWLCLAGVVILSLANPTHAQTPDDPPATDEARDDEGDDPPGEGEGEDEDDDPPGEGEDEDESADEDSDEDADEDSDEVQPDPEARAELQIDEELIPEPPPRLETIPGLYPLATGVFVDQGFWAGTPDRKFTLRMSGFAHLDTRFGTDRNTPGPNEDIFFRRIRLTLDGRIFGQFEYRVMFDHIIDPLKPYDAHLDWRPRPEVNLRVGKFKSPLGFERRNRSYALLFIERGYPSAIAPNRDLGVFVYGQSLDGFFSYDVAVVSGAIDLDVLGEIRDTPDFAGRIYFQPFRLVEGFEALHYLGVGYSWTYGSERGSENDPRLQNIRATPRRSVYAGRLLFDYSDPDGVTYADGRRFRQSVHGHWRHQQFNTLFEYVRASNQVSRGMDAQGDPEHHATLTHHAWQVQLAYTLNADDENTFFGVTPTRPFDPSKGHWGGATIGLRYQEMYLDQDAFPNFADSDASINAIRSIATSLQWHLNVRFEAQLDVEYAVPRGGGPGGGHMPAEFSLMTRLEARY